VYKKAAVMLIKLEIKTFKMAQQLGLSLDDAQCTYLEKIHQLDKFRQKPA